MVVVDGGGLVVKVTSTIGGEGGVGSLWGVVDG